MKPYRDGVTLKQIIDDGWSRGFHPEQTLEEASEMGFSLSKEDLLVEWKKWDDSYCTHVFSGSSEFTPLLGD